MSSERDNASEIAILTQLLTGLRTQCESGTFNPGHTPGVAADERGEVLSRFSKLIGVYGLAQDFGIDSSRFTSEVQVILPFLVNGTSISYTEMLKMQEVLQRLEEFPELKKLVQSAE